MLKFLIAINKISGLSEGDDVAFHNSSGYDSEDFWFLWPMLNDLLIFQEVIQSSLQLVLQMLKIILFLRHLHEYC